MKTIVDIYEHILDIFVTTGECYGDLCKYCKYNTGCMMCIISGEIVLGGAY